MIGRYFISFEGKIQCVLKVCNQFEYILDEATMGKSSSNSCKYSKQGFYVWKWRYILKTTPALAGHLKNFNPKSVASCTHSTASDTT